MAKLAPFRRLRSMLSKFGSVRQILADKKGISIVEFALVLPVLLTMGLFGTEVARMATVNMTISQIALSLADNASRLGQTDNSGVTPTITEGNVDAVLAGALRDGEKIDLETQGRIILSSLEYDAFEDKQWITWQRCRGARAASSYYGDDDQNNGINGAEIPGMGPGATQITAMNGQAVMYVEIEYNYVALFENPFGSGDKTLRKEAAFLIRDDRILGRDLTGTSSSTETCDEYTDPDAGSSGGSSSTSSSGGGTTTSTTGSTGGTSTTGSTSSTGSTTSGSTSGSSTSTSSGSTSGSTTSSSSGSSSSGGQWCPSWNWWC